MKTLILLLASFISGAGSWAGWTAYRERHSIDYDALAAKYGGVGVGPADVVRRLSDAEFEAYLLRERVKVLEARK